MLVKICGITRQEDADAAVAAGALAIGFVFWPDSPRVIDPSRARAIVARLPAFVTAVGVFVNQPLDFVAGITEDVGLGAVQLHGDENPAYAERVGRAVIKAVAIGNGGAGGSLQEWPQETTLLLDVYDPVNRGGTGRLIDWTAAAAVARERRTILAGGLTPENVAQAVLQVRPFGIDVSSGVERSPGVKDHARIAALFEALHASRS